MHTISKRVTTLAHESRMSLFRLKEHRGLLLTQAGIRTNAQLLPAMDLAHMRIDIPHGLVTQRVDFSLLILPPKEHLCRCVPRNDTYI